MCRVCCCCDCPSLLWCRALSYLSDENGGQRIPAVIQSGVVPRLVELLGSPNTEVVVPCLRTLGNLACTTTRRAGRSTRPCSSSRLHPSHPSVLFCHCVVLGGSDVDTQAVLSAGFLSKLDRLLSHPKANLRKESAWGLSSVLAGPPAQIQSVLDAKLMHTLVQRLLKEEAEYDVKKECAWYEHNSARQTSRAESRSTVRPSRKACTAGVFCAAGVRPVSPIHACAESRRYALFFLVRG